MALGDDITNATMNPIPTLTSLNSVTSGNELYTATGGSGIWRLRSHGIDLENNGQEQYQSTRATKWFSLGDYEKPSKVRRIMMSYSSYVPIEVCVYKDHEILPAFVLSFPSTSQKDNQGREVKGEKELVYKKATTRARVLKLEVKTPSIDSSYYENSKVEIYGIQVEVVPRRGKSD